MEIIYLVADALDTPLHMMENGAVRGCKSRTIKMGPWTLVSDAVICSDELKNKLVSFIFRIKADVWAYLTCEDNGLMLAMIFDGSKLGPSGGPLKSKDVSKMGAGTTEETLKKIKSEIRAVFSFEKTKTEWDQLELGAALGGDTHK